MFKKCQCITDLSISYCYGFCYINWPFKNSILCSGWESPLVEILSVGILLGRLITTEHRYFNCKHQLLIDKILSVLLFWNISHPNFLHFKVLMMMNSANTMWWISTHWTLPTSALSLMYIWSRNIPSWDHQRQSINNNKSAFMKTHNKESLRGEVAFTKVTKKLITSFSLHMERPDVMLLSFGFDA